MISSRVLRLPPLSMPNNTDNISRKVGEKLRRPALHALKDNSGVKSTRIAPPNTLKDPYTEFLPKKAQC